MTMPRCDLARTIVIVATLFAGQLAWSQPAGTADAAYEEGRRLYDLREWDQAIAKFKEAYRLKPEAKSLFNIAQSFRLKGDCVEALNFYRTFKRNFPKEKNVPKVDRFIIELEPCAKTQAGRPAPTVVSAVQPEPRPRKPEPAPRKPQPGQPAPVQPQPQPVIQAEPQPLPPQPAPEQPARAPGDSRRRVGIVLAAGGGLLMVGGAIFGLEAKAAADDVSSGSGAWDGEIEDSGKSADTKAKLLFGLGGASAAIGIILYVTAPKAGRSTGVGLVPQDGGAIFSWSGKL
jgi:tetratricopeptide (TPR) repeat protein